MFDTSSCITPCSGLIVTSFSRNDLLNDLEDMFPEYNNYKNITPYPVGYEGKYFLPEDFTVWYIVYTTFHLRLQMEKQA